MVLVGCEMPSEPEQECSDCFLEMTSNLEIDENGYHHLYCDSNNQTFEQLYANIGYGKDYELVGFTSDTEYCFEWNGTVQCSNVVNGSSYTDIDGVATTILGVYQQHVGDTIKVYGGYYDWYGEQYLDSLEVIING